MSRRGVASERYLQYIPIYKSQTFLKCTTFKIWSENSLSRIVSFIKRPYFYNNRDIRTHARSLLVKCLENEKLGTRSIHSAKWHFDFVTLIGKIYGLEFNDFCLKWCTMNLHKPILYRERARNLLYLRCTRAQCSGELLDFFFVGWWWWVTCLVYNGR